MAAKKDKPEQQIEISDEENDQNPHEEISKEQEDDEENEEPVDQYQNITSDEEENEDKVPEEVIIFSANLNLIVGRF